jgi:hypothetical protein
MRPGTKRVIPSPNVFASSGRIFPRHHDTLALPPARILPSHVSQPLVSTNRIGAPNCNSGRFVPDAV